MKTKLTSLFQLVLCVGLLSSQPSIYSQASLTIENNSGRYMTVKVMKGKGKGVLHEIVKIPSYNSETVYFSESGTYFTKTKAVLRGSKPVCRKGESFWVTNDDTGYSVMTMTFTIRESRIPVATGGVTISEAEFDRN